MSMRNEFISQVNLAMISFAKQAYLEAIQTLALAYTSENLWDTTGQTQVTVDGLMHSLEIVTRLVQLPEIEAQIFVQAIMQQMQQAIEQLKENNTELFEEAIKNFQYLVNALNQGITLLHDQGIVIGQKDDPVIKLGLFLEQGQINVQLYGRISSSPRGLSQAEAQQLQEAFLEVLQEGTAYQQMINTASRLSNQGQYQESNTVLEKIINDYPEEQGSSLNLLGANWFFLANYEKAIDFYLQARAAGENEEMIDFNVWEACRELYKVAATPEEALKWKNYYEQLFPMGRNRF